MPIRNEHRPSEWQPFFFSAQGRSSAVAVTHSSRSTQHSKWSEIVTIWLISSDRNVTFLAAACCIS